LPVPPEPVVSAEPPAVAAELEPPRRRSTVREPASVVVADAASGEAVAPPEPVAPREPPQPIVTSSKESDEGDRPPRSGWWSRRAMGGQKS
jgi:ribonuclease E